MKKRAKTATYGYGMRTYRGEIVVRSGSIRHGSFRGKKVRISKKKG